MLAGADVSGSGKLEVTNLTWSGGVFREGVAIKVLNATISGATVKTLARSTISFSGAVTWSGAGDIIMIGEAVLTNGGQFDIKTDATIRAIPVFQLPPLIQLEPAIRNFGTFSKTTGSQNEIQPEFDNAGILDLKPGPDASPTKLHFGAGVRQIDGRTFLHGGTIIVDGFGFLNLGSGLISMGAKTGRISATYFEQGKNATLQMVIDGSALGDFSTISVKNQATFNGTIALVFSAGFGRTVNPGESLPLITYGSATGDFSVTDNLPPRVIKGKLVDLLATGIVGARTYTIVISA